MTAHFWTPFLASALAAAFTTAGLYVIRRFERLGRLSTGYFAAFAAGVLISVSFLHLIPTSIGANRRAPIYLLVGYLAMYCLNRFITAYVCDKPTTSDYAIGLVPMFGMGLHSLIDGIIYCVTFSVSAFTGAMTAVGLILHEFPEGIVLYILLQRAGFPPRSALLLAFIAAALTTPLGMLLSYPFISAIDETALGAMLSLSAGALVYVGATHLLPHAEHEQRKYSLIAVATGIAVAIGIVLTHAHVGHAP